MSIKIEHRNLEIRKTRNDFFVQVRNILLPLSLKVFRHNLTILAFSSVPHNTCVTRHKASRASESQPSRSVSSLNSTNWLFQNLPKSSARFRCVTSFALASLRFPTGLLWHLRVTRSLCARAWTPVLMLHLSNPCTEPKGSQLNSTQRHETKPLGYYVTWWPVVFFLFIFLFVFYFCNWIDNHDVNISFRKFRSKTKFVELYHKHTHTHIYKIWK